jgi:hypothetical protein
MNKQDILRDLEIQRLAEVQKTSAIETFLKSHHLTKINERELSIDMDAYKNNITSEQDDDICEFLKEHAMIITLMKTRHVYKNHYMLSFEFPEYIKGWQAEDHQCKNNRLYVGPFQDELHVHLTNRTWLGTYHKTITLTPSDMNKVATAKDVLEEVLENFERCLCLKDCYGLVMDLSYHDDQTIASEDLTNLKERLMISPIRNISFFNESKDCPVYCSFGDKLNFPNMNISSRMY